MDVVNLVYCSFDFRKVVDFFNTTNICVIEIHGFSEKYPSQIMIKTFKVLAKEWKNGLINFKRKFHDQVIYEENML